jgi:hypothetical protein
MDYYRQPQRDIPVAGQSDVLVCGGGPAGVAAAICAARQGATVRLIELAGCLGGIWTSGCLSWFCDAGNKRGLLEELIQELERRHGRPYAPGPRLDGFNPEVFKLLLDELCLRGGIEVQLHTRVVSAFGEGRELKYALTESKSGPQAWAARVFVDCTGDGDLAAQAGCRFDVGRPENGQTQPMSLIAVLAGVHVKDLRAFVDRQASTHAQRTSALRAEFNRAGVDPSYAAPGLFRVHDDLLLLMANHEYGVSALSAADVTRATLAARAEVHRLVAALRGLGGPWANLQLVATSSQIGTREGRRIAGRYRVTADDLVAGARHPDAICRVTFPVDVHSTDPAKGKAYDNSGVRSQPYDVPLRALESADLDNLLMAGRCISGDFLAHASYRVTGNATPMGQAAGTLAGLAVRLGLAPQQVPWEQVAQSLQQQGALPL